MKNGQFGWIKLSIYIFVLASSLIIYGYRFPSGNNLVEVPPVLSLLNPDLYQHDYYVQENIQFSPRYYYQYLIYLTVSLIRSFPLTYFFYYTAAFSSFVLGLYALGRRFGQSDLSAAALAFLGLTAIDGTLGTVELFRDEAIPAVLAMGFAIWGIYFCLCRRWVFGYLFFGLATLLQFLVGIFPGIMMAPLLIFEAKQRKTVALSLLILGSLAGSVYLPMMLGGNTGTEIISNSEFVYLYGYVRHPHHIIPSRWPAVTWRSFIYFVVGGILCIQSTNLHPKYKRNFILIIYASLIALFLGYFFVEIYPLALFAKLQLARTTPFAQLMVLIAISVLIEKYYYQKNVVACVLLLAMPSIENGAIALLILSILIVTRSLQIFRHKLVVRAATAGIVIFTLIAVALPSLHEIREQLFWKTLLFSVLAFPFFIGQVPKFDQAKTMIVSILGGVSCLFLIFGVLEALPQPLLNTFQEKVSIYKIPEDSEVKLALRFRQRSLEDAVVLVPPLNEKFRFYSQRAVVFDFKSFPYTDRGIKEWKNRMETLTGSIKVPVSKDDLDLKYSQRSSSELVEIARRFGAIYILTRSDWHSDIDGEIVDREAEWVIYRIDGISGVDRTKLEN